MRDLARTRPLLAAALAIVIASAGGAQQRAGGPRLPRGDERALARILAMADARRLDTALVDSVFAGGGPHLRAATARAVGQVGGAARAPALRTLLADPDTAVGAEAAFALGLMRDSAAVPALAAALGRIPAGVEAAWSLGEIGAPARDEVIRGLASDRLPGAVTVQLLLAASRLRPVPLAAILPHTKGAEPTVAWAAAYAISRPAVAGGVRALLALSASPDAGTRMLVAAAFARRAAGDSLYPLVRDSLRMLARDRDARVRVNAARALASFGAPERATVVTLLSDRDPNVRIAAAQALSTVADTSTAWWREAWQRDTSLTFRRSVLESAARRDVELPALAAWLSNRDWQRRAAAIGAVGQLPRPGRRGALARALLRDPQQSVRAEAFSIALGDTAAAARDSLVRAALVDAGFEVRMAGLTAMRSGFTARAVAAAAVDAYRRAQGDRENDARLLALSVLRAAWRADSAAFDPVTLEALHALPRARDPLERAAAAGMTPLEAWGPATGEARPIAWYDSIVRAVVRPSLEGRLPRVELRTERGTITMEMFGADAPLTVENFMRLARSGYYSGTQFHRVVPNFVAQDGDPTGTGSGGPGYAIRDELNRRRYLRGTLGMALSGPDTGGSQYFLCHSAQPHLDGHYPVFGRLASGAGVLDRIVQGDRIRSVHVR